MSYTDEQWDNVMAHLNEEAEKAEPDGIGHVISTADDLVQVLRIVEAIKPAIVNSNRREAREFRELQRAKREADQSSIDLQAQIDAHPGNTPRRP